MAELVHQTWTRITGRPWSYAAKGGFTTGSFADNIALQKRLLGGWNPFSGGAGTPSGSPAAAPATPSTAAAPRPGTVFRAGSSPKVYLMGQDGLAHHITSGATLAAMGFDRSSIGSIPSLASVGISVGTRITEPPSTPGPVPVDPGLAARQWEAALALQKQIAEEQARLQEEAQADVRRTSEAQLSANPADFVAYELYRRQLEEEGFTPERASRSDVDIQNLFNVALGLEGSEPLPEGFAQIPENVAGGIYGLGVDPSAATLGKGQFGVNLPTTGSISRSELQSYSPTDLGILESFLRGGVETGGGFQGINPQDFFTELEEGLIPTLTPQRTQFRF